MSSEKRALVRRAASGEREAISSLWTYIREQLRRLLSKRFDKRLAARLDASDITQDALVQAAKHLPEYLERGTVPLDVWLYALSNQQLARARRRHLHTEKRDARMEIKPDEFPETVATSSPEDSPSVRVMRREDIEQLRNLLRQLPQDDREVLTLRYLEGLSTSQVAALLHASDNAIKIRTHRAVKRLRLLFGAQHRG